MPRGPCVAGLRCSGALIFRGSKSRRSATCFRLSVGKEKPGLIAPWRRMVIFTGLIYGKLRSQLAALGQVIAIDLVLAGDNAIVVGEPDPANNGTDDALLVEAAFMETGRPALVVPYVGVRAMPPGRVIIAWDGSREAARAVHDALPLLRLADDVIILIINAGKLGVRFGQHPGAGVLAHLTRHEISARVKAVQSGGTAIGKLILTQADEEEADLLVMGGYGHSRLREMMLGGVTRHMLEHMSVPVLFAH